jgi:CubicO group peptidase (beta-lactamase class C family)
MMHERTGSDGREISASLPALALRILALALVWTTTSLRSMPAAAEEQWPGRDWLRATPAETGMDEARLRQARDYALTGGGSGYVIRHHPGGARLVMAWGSPTQRYDLKSSTKAIGVTALGLAVTDGKMKLTDKAARYHPSLGVPPETNRATGWLDEITLLHLATQTAGFEKPGGYTRLLFRPGTRWHYSDGGPNWLAECVTLVYGRDLQELLFERVFTPLGIRRSDLVWRKNAYRPENIRDPKTSKEIPRREFGSGISANVDAMARIGYLYLRGGRWKDRQILSKDFADTVRTTVPGVVGLPEQDAKTYGNASDHYGLLWWNNADGTLAGVPRDAFWSWGLYDSLIVVIPSLDVVAARAGKSWKRENGSGHYDVLRPFLEPIAASVTDAAPAPAAPYPPSRAITGVSWAPVSTIVRRAAASDNWPITWGDDDALYTAYGDGWGFEPRVPEKLSLGLARITGPPTQFQGLNLRCPTAQQRGDGPSGKKASGMLMLDGTLYMWVRNAGNSQLAWSADHGRTWKWSQWRFTVSFGCPTLLNFGRDYSGARDEFVYVYSQDSDSAYRGADRMVLARVPKAEITQREAYEFFCRLDAAGRPVWTKDIGARGAVFTHPGRCYRSGISYNAPLRRYLWCQRLPPGVDDRGPRSEGGFGIYDAPEPWGPWTTVYFTEHWDVDPGETSSFPTKWISRDGQTLYLVFSGDDSFSVRKVVVDVGPEAAG